MNELETSFRRSLAKAVAFCFGCVMVAQAQRPSATGIDRQAVVTRNNPQLNAVDTLGSLSVGNGRFAMTVDVTGLQSFPVAYSKGVPLGTMSDWGWHSFPNTQGYQFGETLREYDFGRGRKEVYAAQIRDNERQKAAGNYFRNNPHRLHLGTMGLSLGNDLMQIKDIRQQLDMWKGIINSHFSYRGHLYDVATACHPQRDLVAADIQADTKFALDFKYPYPSGQHCDDGCDWQKDQLHITDLIVTKTGTVQRQDAAGRQVKVGRGYALLRHTLDTTVYYIAVSWEGDARLKKVGRNAYQLMSQGRHLSVCCEYAPSQEKLAKAGSLSWTDVAAAAETAWNGYWKKGAIVDFSHCTDARARELERRVVLSQYLMGIQDAGDTPPQETGLTYNSWFGKFHLEMILWHQAQFALWGHPELLDRSLSWYASVEDKARQIARRQGFKGVRWMKMTDPSGIEAPSNVGSFLIWQQPHLIYLAELLYRANPSPAVIEKYGRLVEETAEFMADFAVKDSTARYGAIVTPTGEPVDKSKQSYRYILRGYIPAQETLQAAVTFNSPYELSYWHCALSMAQLWRERRGLQRDAHWDDIIDHLAALAHKDGLYLAAESAPDTYTNERMISDHPAVTGAVGVLPYNPRQVDMKLMHNTFEWIWKNWYWNTSWGWDFPMMAMCAARIGEPARAVDALLMKQQKNTYLVNGHNYQDGRLRLYLPGNGGLLMAVGMMCAGWDGSTHPNPGFPRDGKWDVRWEGLSPMP